MEEIFVLKNGGMLLQYKRKFTELICVMSILMGKVSEHNQSKHSCEVFVCSSFFLLPLPLQDNTTLLNERQVLVKWSLQE